MHLVRILYRKFKDFDDPLGAVDALIEANLEDLLESDYQVVSQISVQGKLFSYSPLKHMDKHQLLSVLDAVRACLEQGSEPSDRSTARH